MMVKAWDVHDLTPAERLVLLALAECADRDGRNAFKSESTIADYVQVNIRTVRRSLETLKARQLIDVQEARRQHRPTTYRLFPARPDIVPGLKSGSDRTSDRTNKQSRPDIGRGRTLDPLLDPVDPLALLGLFAKRALEVLTEEPTIRPDQLRRRLEEWGNRRAGLRGQCTPELGDAAVTRALQQRKAETA